MNMKYLLFSVALLIPVSISAQTVVVGSEAQVNYTPTASPQEIFVQVNVPHAMSLAGSDADGSALTFSIVDPPSFGTISNFNPAMGQLTYTPAPGFPGEDAFTFTVSDGFSVSEVAAVFLIEAPPCFILSIHYRGSGSNPTMVPEHSVGCAQGSFHAGEQVALIASPSSGWHVRKWTGTENDVSTDTTNTMTMPTRSAIASVLYGADETSSYYASLSFQSQSVFRAALHSIIDDHTRFPLSSPSSADIWDILELADEDPTDASKILDLYKNAVYLTEEATSSSYGPEQVWPSSYGFPNEGANNYPYSDCHAIFLADAAYKSSRSNNPYRSCSPSCTEKVTNLNHGRGGGVGVYPGNSNWLAGSGPTGTWEAWHGRRGDIARALFYLDLRYEGGVHGVTSSVEPDLILTDNPSLITPSGGVNTSVAYMGLLSTLLAWHESDPVDNLERYHNEVVYSFQGNRNPFIDHPEWVSCAMAGECNSILRDGFEKGNADVWVTWPPN